MCDYLKRILHVVIGNPGSAMLHVFKKRDSTTKTHDSPKILYIYQIIKDRLK